MHIEGLCAALKVLSELRISTLAYTTLVRSAKELNKDHTSTKLKREYCHGNLALTVHF